MDGLVTGGVLQMGQTFEVESHVSTPPEMHGDTDEGAPLWNTWPQRRARTLSPTSTPQSRQREHTHRGQSRGGGREVKLAVRSTGPKGGVLPGCPRGR